MDTLSHEEFKLIAKLSPLYYEKFGPAYQRVDSQDKLLNKNQIRALMIIGRRGRITNSELGKTLYMKKGSVTTLIDGLMEKKMIQKDNDPNDRRKTWISLTTAGKEHREMKCGLLKVEMSAIVSQLSQEDQQNLKEGLAKVVAVLDKI